MPAGKKVVYFLLGCADSVSLSRVTMLQIVGPNQMAGGAGHMLRWFDKTQAQRVSTGSPVHPCCVHHRRGEANAVPHVVQF